LLRKRPAPRLVGILPDDLQAFDWAKGNLIVILVNPPPALLSAWMVAIIIGVQPIVFEPTVEVSRAGDPCLLKVRDCGPACPVPSHVVMCPKHCENRCQHTHSTPAVAPAPKH